MKFSIKQWFNVTVLGLAMLLLAGGAVAQPPTSTGQKPQPASFTGKYEGVIKVEDREQKLTLDLIEEAGKFSGTFTTARGSFKVLKGAIADGVLTLEVERPGGPAPGTIPLRRNGDNLIATLTEGDKSWTVEFRKVLTDEISGEWDAAADAQGQAVPFTLVLKLEGEKVTGSSSSQLGNSNISSGAWKDGKLTLLIESASGGTIGLVATLDGGKLVGDYDFAGQLQGKWVAIKKK
jgi:hypothetical protein